MPVVKSYDLIVIGTGAAASTVAHNCGSAGWKVAIIDSRPFGGTCALRGCDPKKVLVSATEVIDWNERMQGKGIENAKAAGINWPKLMRFKRSFTEPVPKSREKVFSDAGIAGYHGRARFTSSTTISVEDEELEGKYIVIATGAKPAMLNVPGEGYVTTSDQFLELIKLPKKIVFIGGGYISFEFAHVAARAGSKVTILHRGKKSLEKFDPDLVDMLLQRTKELGIEVELQTSVEAVEKKSASNFRVRASAANVNDSQKVKKNYNAELVVHGAGRVPEIEDLNLEVADVEYDKKKGVKVNEYMQSVSNPAVYAAGDSSGRSGLRLTPVASYEGQLVSRNLLENNVAKANYIGIPSVVFTLPPIASVGLREDDANKNGLKFKKNFGSTATWYSSKRIGEKFSGYKTLIEEGSGRILGAHLLGPHAEEVINLFAMAIRLGLNSEDMKKAIFTYPTNSSDVNYML